MVKKEVESSENYSAPLDLSDPSIHSSTFTKKEQRCLTLLENWDRVHHLSLKQKRKLLKRIPWRLHGISWRHISGSFHVQCKNQGVYEELCLRTSPVESYIQKDLLRTFPHNNFFNEGERGYTALFNILKCYSLMDPSIGYCQGMSFLVGHLLFFMNEVDAFWCFFQMMKQHAMCGFFTRGLSTLKASLYTVDRLIETHLPNLFFHFKREGVTPLLFASEWLTTLFTTSLSLGASATVWDLFFLDGIPYLHRTCIAILRLFESTLLKLHFEEIMNFLKTNTKTLQEQQVYKAIESLNIPTLSITVLMKEMETMELGDTLHPHYF